MVQEENLRNEDPAKCGIEGSSCSLYHGGTLFIFQSILFAAQQELKVNL
jgi:hypothetical protein